MGLGDNTAYIFKSVLKESIKKYLKGKLLGALSTRLAFISNPLAGLVTHLVMSKIVGPVLDEVHETVYREVAEIKSRKKGKKLKEAETDEDFTDAFGDL